jgi:hypothetical protein
VSPLLIRRRRRGIEYLDDPACDPDVRATSIGDVARANRFLGGTRAAVAELEGALRDVGGRNGHVTLLDVGTGLGDIPANVREVATRTNVSLTTIGLDAVPSLAVASRRRVDYAVCGDALSLPVADRGVDVVLCSQLLHHFEYADALRLLRELDRVARVRVVVSDLRRSAAAAAGLWLASFPMRFHRVSRHDGVVSVLRGFTVGELAELVREAVGARPTVKRHFGWRVTASWTPAGAMHEAPLTLGPLPVERRMRTVDERAVRAPLATIFSLAADVERWPEHLAHYRYVRFHHRDGRGGGIVEMSANRPFGPVAWPSALHSVPAHPRHHDGDGRRMELPADQWRHPRKNRACVERTALACDRRHRGRRRHRACLRARDRLAHTGRARGSGGTPRTGRSVRPVSAVGTERPSAVLVISPPTAAKLSAISDQLPLARMGSSLSLRIERRMQT